MVRLMVVRLCAMHGLKKIEESQSFISQMEDCLMRDVQENLDVLPSDSNLAGAEIELLDLENTESV